MQNQKTEVEPGQKAEVKRGRWKLLLVLAVCAAPMIASYFTYYVIKPSGRTNYGTLLEPRDYPLPRLDAVTLDGKPKELEAFKGKWLMIQTGSGQCAASCQELLTHMRQLRLMQGKEKDRIERVWLITDSEPLDTLLMREFDGTHMLRVNAAALTKWLPVEANTALDQHLYLIDPLGNLMMRYPARPDPNKMKKDISKLLKASAIG